MGLKVNLRKTKVMVSGGITTNDGTSKSNVDPCGVCSLRVKAISSVEKANLFCDFLCTVLDKPAPPSLQKVITHNSSPWFESIRDELFIAKRERRQAEEMEEHKVNYFQGLVQTGKAQGFKTCAHS